MNYLRHLLSILLATLCIGAWAQTLSVESFKLLPNDLTANTYGTMERDQNGEVAALIKVVTSETGFVFDGGMMGIVKTEQKTGEIWVYVPHGIQRITISHQHLGVLRDYFFPVAVEKARTYEMKLFSGRVRTVIEDEFTAQYVTFMIEPRNAIVYIDGNPHLAQSDGTVSQLLAYGSHEYRVELPGYKTVAGTVQVGSEKITQNIVMESSLATITIQCGMPEADIYVNDEKKGTGTWTGQLVPALYKIEAKREGYQTRLMTLNVGELEVRTVSVPEPLPLYGRLQIQSDPINAQVFIDGEEMGTTPLLTKQIQVGVHNLELKKDEYLNYSTSVSVAEQEITELNIKLISAGFQRNPDLGVTQSSKTEQSQVREPKPKKERVSREKKELFKPNSFYASYFVMGDEGPVSPVYTFLGIQIGCYFKNINVELNALLPDYDWEYGLHGYWTMIPEDLNGDGVLDDSEGTTSFWYRYGLDTQMSLRIGYGIKAGRMFRFTPQAGLMNQIIVSEYDASLHLFDDDDSKKTYTVGAQLDVKMEFSPIRHVSVFCTPGYTIPIKMGQIATKLNGNDNAVKKLLGGMYVNFGASINF